VFASYVQSPFAQNEQKRGKTDYDPEDSRPPSNRSGDISMVGLDTLEKKMMSLADVIRVKGRKNPCGSH
jgi:hypothetical protein